MMSLREADPQSLSELMMGDPDQMLALFKSLIAGGLPPADVQQAIRDHNPGGDLASIMGGEGIAMLCPWPAINGTQQVTTQPVEETINIPIAQRSQNAVSVRGSIIYMKQFWAGAMTGMYGEIGVNSVMVLPGASLSGTPLLGAQMILGPGSQVGFTNSSANAMYGNMWGIPPLLVPPPLAALPDYTNAAWTSGNLNLYKPLSIEPWIPMDSSSAFSAVLVRFQADMQPKRSFYLSREYTMGRMIVANGRLGLNANSTNLNTSGSATISQVQSFRIAGITQAGLKAQGSGKSASADWLGSTVGPQALAGGVRFLQSTQVVEELQAVDYNKITGGVAAIAENFDVINLPASGVSGSYLGGTSFQAAFPSQTGASGPFLNNGIYDRLTGTYMAARFYSDRFKINFQYAQSPFVNETACRVGSATDDVCNTYQQQYLSTDNCNKYSNAINVQMPVSDELFPMTFELEWSIGMGAARSCSFGQAVDVWIQIMPDGTVNFDSRTTGLGVWGLTGADSKNERFGPTGCVVGGMPQTHKYTHQAKRLTTESDSIYSWTYAGTLFLFNSMADAVMQCNVTLTAPELYSVGVSYPGVICRVDGASEGQFLTMNLQEYWEVVATERTRAIVKGPQLSPPMMNQGFPSLMKALWRESDLPWFSNCYRNDDYMSKVGIVLSMKSPAEMWGFLKLMNVLKHPTAFMHLVESNPFTRFAHSKHAKALLFGKEEGGTMWNGKPLYMKPLKTFNSSGQRQLDKLRNPRENPRSGAMFGGGMFSDGDYCDDNNAEAGGMFSGGMFSDGDYCGDNNADAGGMFSDGDYCGDSNANAGGMFSDGSFQDEDMDAAGGFWDTIGNIAGTAANIATPLALQYAQKRMGADQGFFDSQTGTMEIFGGSINKRLQWKIEGQPWLSCASFGVVRNKVNQREVDVGQLIAGLGLQKSTLVAFSEMPAVRQQYPYVAVLGDVEKQYETEKAGGKVARRVSHLYGWNKANDPVAIDQGYLGFARAPFDYCLIFGVIAGERWVLPGAVVRRILRALKKDMHQYLAGHSDNQPTVTASLKEGATSIVSKFISRMKKQGYTANSWLGRIFAETEKTLKMPPDDKSTRHDIEYFAKTDEVLQTHKRPKPAQIRAMMDGGRAQSRSNIYDSGFADKGKVSLLRTKPGIRPREETTQQPQAPMHERSDLFGGGGGYLPIPSGAHTNLPVTNRSIPQKGKRDGFDELFERSRGGARTELRPTGLSEDTGVWGN